MLKYIDISFKSLISPEILRTQKRFLYNSLKKIIDLFFSFLLLIILVFPFIIVAALIKCDSKGQIFYTQKRGGVSGKPFVIYKLRTLYTHLCDDGSKQVVVNDDRITKVGYWLRRFHIDELPQLLNVLKGDMTLVGPRPHSVSMDDYYSSHIANYKKRFRVKPGLTGLAQIQGLKGQTLTIQDMKQRIDLDNLYIEKRSFYFDIIILLKTAQMIFKNENKKISL